MKHFQILMIALAGSLTFSLASADTHKPLTNASLQTSKTSACLPKAKAEAEAEALAQKAAQTYCRKEGFGWHAATVKTLGNLDCQRCGTEAYACVYSDASLECRKAEPKLSWSGWFSDTP
jgi:hypothetical protein